MKLHVTKTRQFNNNGALFKAWVKVIPTGEENDLIKKYHLESRAVTQGLGLNALSVGVNLGPSDDPNAVEKDISEIRNGLTRLLAYVYVAEAFTGEHTEELP